jgi:hypothetical protein
MAVGNRTNLRVVEPVSPLACPLREASRHPRSILIAWMRSDLLALPPSAMADELATAPLLLADTWIHQLKRSLFTKRVTVGRLLGLSPLS